MARSEGGFQLGWFFFGVNDGENFCGGLGGLVIFFCFVEFCGGLGGLVIFVFVSLEFCGGLGGLVIFVFVSWDSAVVWVVW